jgi:hypothetical protein
MSLAGRASRRRYGMTAISINGDPGSLTVSSSMVNSTNARM